MSSSDVYKSKDWIIEKAFIKIDNYEAMYKQSIVEPDEFWFQHCLLYTSPSPRDDR